MYFGLRLHFALFVTDCLASMGIGFLLLFKFNHGKWKKDKVGLRRLVVLWHSEGQACAFGQEGRI